MAFCLHVSLSLAHICVRHAAAATSRAIFFRSKFRVFIFVCLSVSLCFYVRVIYTVYVHALHTHIAFNTCFYSLFVVLLLLVVVSKLQASLAPNWKSMYFKIQYRQQNYNTIFLAKRIPQWNWPLSVELNQKPIFFFGTCIFFLNNNGIIEWYFSASLWI